MLVIALKHWVLAWHFYNLGPVCKTFLPALDLFFRKGMRSKEVSYQYRH